MRSLVVTVALCCGCGPAPPWPAHRLGTIPRQADSPRSRLPGLHRARHGGNGKRGGQSARSSPATRAQRYKDRSRPDYWEHFRSLLTQEVNATIKGARAGGAASFVVNEGHGGNLFANVLPWELDSSAILVRGFPKPLVMVTGIDSSFGTLMFTGAHANAGSPGVMAHNFAFDSFTVNGKVLNEVGINALIAGEMGVSVSLVSGDDVLIAETKPMLNNGFVAIVTKHAVGRSAAITYSPAKVRQMLQAGAAEAVKRARPGRVQAARPGQAVPGRVQAAAQFRRQRRDPGGRAHRVQARQGGRPHLHLHDRTARGRWAGCSTPSRRSVIR